MNKLKHYDYLIVGQGLAGSLLAWRLIEAGQRVLVVDNDSPTAASRVAAGLINPVTGKRLVKESKAQAYLAVARECYANLAEQFGQVFLHDKPMLRLFNNDEFKQVWLKRREDPDYNDYIGAELSPDECGYEQGGFVQYQTGYLSTSVLLTALREWLVAHSALVTMQIDYAEIQITTGIHWREYSAERIIFCEGARVVNNPWFNFLPMQPVQGEILTLQTTGQLPQWIINGGRWLLPLEDGRFKIGATYVWPTEDNPLDERISDAGQATLLDAISRLFPALKDQKLIAHDVGIRPSSKDRRPLIGFHPQFPQLAVFNGFGSKGSMLIPFYTQHFVDVLLNGASLDSDVDIKRTIP